MKLNNYKRIAKYYGTCDPKFWNNFLDVFIFFLALPVFALIDILESHFANNDKLVWTIVVILLIFFEPLLYFLIGRKQKILKKE